MIEIRITERLIFWCVVAWIDGLCILLWHQVFGWNWLGCIAFTVAGNIFNFITGGWKIPPKENDPHSLD